MAYLAEILMEIEVTNSGSVQPLVKYLRDGKPLTDDMRKWLIELLEPKKKTPVWLKLMRKRGRRRTNDKIFEAYYRVQELTNAKITGTSVRDIVKKLPGRELKIERPLVRTRYSIRYKPAVYHVRKNYGTEFTFIEGRKLPHEMACKIAALQFRLSFSYVKKSYREIEA
jgi:hypothetical protein